MCRRRRCAKKCCFPRFFMGQAASIPSNHCHVDYPRQPMGNHVRTVHSQEHPSHMPAVPSAPVLCETNAIVVPVHYYPNSFYTPSAGGSIMNRIEDSLTAFKDRLTEGYGQNLFFEQYRDPNIPIPPGHLVHTTSYRDVRMNATPGAYTPHQTNFPPSYRNPTSPPATSHAFYGSPPPYTPTAPLLEESLELDDMEKKMKKLDVGSKT